MREQWQRASRFSGQNNGLLTDGVSPVFWGSVLCGEVAKRAAVDETFLRSGFHDGALLERGVPGPKVDRLTLLILPSEWLEQIEREIADQRYGEQ